MAILFRIFFGILIAVTLLAGPLQAAESEDAQLFIAGFNAYQKEEYGVAVQKLSRVLKEYPTSPLRDMTLFWLARASYRTGDRTEAARAMSRFLKEYPDHPLKGTVEEELLKLAAQYDQGYTIAQTPDQSASKQPKATSLQAPEKPAPAAPSSVEEKPVSPVRPVEVTPPDSKTVMAKAEPLPAPPLPPAAATIPPLEKPETAPAQESSPEAVEAKASEYRPDSPDEETPPKPENAAVSQPQPPVSSVTTTSPPATAMRPVPERTVIAKDSPNVSEQLPVKKSRRSRRQERKEALRDKAVADYRATIERYPGTSAAAEAADRLRKLGAPTRAPVSSSGTGTAVRVPVTVAQTAETSPVSSAPSGIAVTGEAGASQVVTLEIEQYADLGLVVTLPALRQEAGIRVSIPLEVSNRGNGADSFSLESGFPADCSPRFTTATTSDAPLSATPNLAPGETWHGILSVALPPGAVDGQKLRYPVRATSRFSRNISRTSEVLLTVSAPLLRGIMKPDPIAVLPRETVSYRITLLNIGSAPARSVRFRLDYPAPLDPVSLSGFRQESGFLVMDNFGLASGESRETTVTFRLKASTPARQDLICRGELVNPALQTRETFVSTAASVQPVYNITLAALQDRLFSLPGQTVTVPVTVTNTGNIREPVIVTTNSPAGYRAALYNDRNRNGSLNPNEPALKQTAALAPNETVHLILEIGAPADAGDGSESTVMITAAPASGTVGKVAANLRVTVARPLVKLAASGGAGRLKPGEVASVEVVCLNRGSALARSVTVRSVLPPQLELVATDPTAAANRSGELTWTIPELGAGEKRTMRLTYRVKPGITAGASLTVTNRVTYEDHLGNRY